MIHSETLDAAKQMIKRAIEMEQLRYLVALSGKVIGLSYLGLIISISEAKASMPKAWQLGTQDPVSPVAVQINEFHDFLLWLITLISLFVLGLMVYVCFRFKASRNPNPSKTTHSQRRG